MEKRQKFESLSNLWKADEISNRFISRDHLYDPAAVKVVTQIEKSEYDIILVNTKRENGSFGRDSLLLFNHGIFVKDFADMLPTKFNYGIFLNIKKGPLDLHISREDVIMNDKWFLLLQNVCDDIIENLVSEVGKTDIKAAITVIADMIDFRFSYEVTSESDFFFKNPFFGSFFRKAPFQMIKDEKLNYTTLNDFMVKDSITVCHCTSIYNEHEIKLLMDSGGHDQVLINTYRLPTFQRKTNELGLSPCLIEQIATLRGKEYSRLDLHDLLLSIAVTDENDYSKIAPPNVMFASFGKYKPLCVVKKYPKVSDHTRSLGHGYWGNLLLFWELLEPERQDIFRDIIGNEIGERYSKIELIEPPQIILDSTDTFLKEILSLKDDMIETIAGLVERYFKYLSYLPFIMHDLSSLLFLIDSIDDLENRIAQEIGVNRPEEILKRFAPNAYIYYRYWDTYGLRYILE